MKKVANPRLTAKNPHFGNRYADLPEVLRVVNEALEPGEEIYQTVHVTEAGFVFHTALLCDGETVLQNDIPFIIGKQDPQGLGSAITYYRRYGLVLLFNLVAEDDDDGNAATPPKPKKSKPAKPKAAPKNTVEAEGDDW